MNDRFSAIIYFLIAVVMYGVCVPFMLMRSVWNHMVSEFPRIIRRAFALAKADVISLWKTGEYAEINEKRTCMMYSHKETRVFDAD